MLTANEARVAAARAREWPVDHGYLWSRRGYVDMDEMSHSLIGCQDHVLDG